MVRKDNIIGTLNFGIKLNNKFFIILLICFFSNLLVCVTPVICYLVFLPLECQDLIVFIIFSLVFLICGITIICLWLKQTNFFNKTINKYLNDPFLFLTTADIFEIDNVGYGLYKKYKVAASFNYKGKNIIFDGKKYCKQFKNFIGKRLSVLYSPKYEQVLILKL